MLARAELVAVADRLVGGRAHLVRPPRPDQVLLAERHPHVRPVELVRRAEEHVDVPGGHVDRAVRAVVDGVGPGERADAVGELDDAPHIGRGADRVGRDRERDDAGAVVELRLRGCRSRARGRRARRPGATTMPRSSWSASQGATLPSWSSRVTSTSSPAFSSRASARVRRKLSEVMLWPNATSSPEQPRNEPAFSWARSTSALVRRDVSYGAPTLALSCLR